MRRMIDPQVIIKSQVVDDKYSADLNELLEKYGTEGHNTVKTVTLQIYSKEVNEDNSLYIATDTGSKGRLAINTAITITKTQGGDGVFIRGVLFNTSFTNFLPYIQVDDEDYENGIMLLDSYEFDVHVIKV